MIQIGDKQTELYRGKYHPAELHGPQVLPAILWNQQISYRRYPTDYSSGIQARQVGNETVYTLTKESGEGVFFEKRRIIKGHRYYARIHARPDTKNQSVMTLCYKFALGDVYPIVIPTTRIEQEQDAEVIVTASYSSNNRDHINLWGTVGDTIAISNLQLFDLTEMFGEGNEPKSPEQFREMFPESYYPFDSGTWKRLPIGASSSFEATFTDRFTGWKEVEASGTEIVQEDTYDDRLNLTLHGKHSQYHQNEVSANYSGDSFSFQAEENSYLRSAVVSGNHTQVTGYAVKLNQLFRPFAFATSPRTSNGITITPSEDGTEYVLNGTATSITRFLIVVSSTIGYSITGRKFLMRGCPPGGSEKTFHMDGYACNYDTGDGYLGTCFYNYRTITVEEGVTVENLVFRPEIIDLTEMFGEGNEPTSIAEFEAMFPDEFYPQNLGEYRLAPDGIVTAYMTPSRFLPQEIIPIQEERLRVRKKNLASEEEWLRVNSTKIAQFENHRCTQTYTKVRDVAFHKVFNLRIGQTYTFSLYGEFEDDNTDNAPVIIVTDARDAWYNVSGIAAIRRSKGVNGRYAVTFIPKVERIRIAISMTSYTDDISGTASVYNVQLEEGGTATEYEPYVEPKEAQFDVALYGNQDTQDSFDMISGTQTKRWGKTEFNGTENWYQYGTVVALALNFASKLHHWTLDIGERCNIAQYSLEGNTKVIPGFFTIYNPGADIKGWIVFHEEMDVADWKAFLQQKYADGDPVYIVYPLREEQTVQTEATSDEVFPDALTIVESEPALSQCKVVVEPQMPSPRFSSEIIPMKNEKIAVHGKNIFDPYGEINYSLYAYQKTFGGHNRADENGNILVWNGSNGFLFGQHWKGLPAGTYTASFDLIDKGDFENKGFYAGFTKNGVFYHYNSYGKLGHHVFHVTVTEKDWFCLFFGFNGATLSTSAKPGVVANVQVEKSAVETDYQPYYSLQAAEADIELFGDGTVNDIFEPCVLVNGEYKCRVTRRWWKVDFEKYRDIIVGQYAAQGNVRCFTISQIGLYDAEPKKKNGWQTSWCSHFKNVNGSYNSFIPGLYSDQPALAGMYFTVEGIPTTEAFKQWYIENKVVTMYQTEEPVVELYDPLPLRTVPRYTYIGNNTGAEMTAKMKVLDV